jgi:hypothetical protein
MQAGDESGHGRRRAAQQAQSPVKTAAGVVAGR